MINMAYSKRRYPFIHSRPAKFQAKRGENRAFQGTDEQRPLSINFIKQILAFRPGKLIKDRIGLFINRHPVFIGSLLYLLGKDNVPVLPDLLVKIETTNACNGNCEYCPRSSMGRPVGFMEDGLYKRIVDECADMGVRNFHLHNYGEPLLDPKIAQRISYAKEKGINDVSIYTNGLLLNEALSKELINAGLDGLFVSIDPPDDNINNRKERKSLPIDKISENIRNFSIIKKRFGIKKPELVITATTFDKDNPSIPGFEKEWLYYVDRILFSPVHNWGGRKTTGGEKELKPCRRLWFNLTILWDGRVALCGMDFDGKYILGDVKNSTLDEIWNSDGYRSIRRQSLKSEYDGNILCKNCTVPNKDVLQWVKSLVLQKGR